MKFRVIVAPSARDDFRTILQWIDKRSPSGAESWYDAWVKALRQLERNPYRGVAPEDAEHELEIRQTFFETRRGRTYRALFTIQDDEVIVLRVRGPAQDLLPPEEIVLPDQEEGDDDDESL